MILFEKTGPEKLGNLPIEILSLVVRLVLNLEITRDRHQHSGSQAVSSTGQGGLVRPGSPVLGLLASLHGGSQVDLFWRGPSVA